MVGLTGAFAGAFGRPALGTLGGRTDEGQRVVVLRKERGDVPPGLCVVPLGLAVANQEDALSTRLPRRGRQRARVGLASW